MKILNYFAIWLCILFIVHLFPLQLSRMMTCKKKHFCFQLFSAVKIALSAIFGFLSHLQKISEFHEKNISYEDIQNNTYCSTRLIYSCFQVRITSPNYLRYLWTISEILRKKGVLNLFDMIKLNIWQAWYLGNYSERISNWRRP